MNLPGRSRRVMIELSVLDIKVVRAALRTIADQDIDELVRKTVATMTPTGMDPQEATDNALTASMVSRDLLAYLAEVLDAEFKEGN